MNTHQALKLMSRKRRVLLKTEAFFRGLELDGDPSTRVAVGFLELKSQEVNLERETPGGHKKSVLQCLNVESIRRPRPTCSILSRNHGVLLNRCSSYCFIYIIHVEQNQRQPNGRFEVIVAWPWAP